MFIRWIVAVLAVVVAWFLALITYVIAVPTIPEAFIPLSAIISNHGLYLLPLGLFGIGLGLVMIQRRNNVVQRWVGAATVLICLLAMAVSVVPLAAAWRTAQERGVALSFGDYLSGGSNTGAPVPSLSETYATVDGAELQTDVKLPVRDSTTPRPAVVWVHGGGWIEGDRGEGPKWHRWLTDRGYAVFAIEYRLAPPPRWNQAPADVKCAIGRIKQKAAQYRIDPDRVMVAGGSAGGNLALLAAYADDRIAPSCPVTDTAVCAVAAFYPPTDLVTGWRDTGDPAFVRKALRDFTGGSPAEFPDRYTAASPVTYVRPGLPPTLLLHGTRDHIVPYSQSTLLADRLAAAGVDHDLLALPYAEHAYDATWGDWATQISRRTLDRFLIRSFPL